MSESSSSSPGDRRSAADRAALEQQLAASQRLLDAVAEYSSDWRGHGGRAFQDAADVLIHTIFARSTRTYEAVVTHLGNRGFGEQAAMLNRSLFEDMVDAHWVSLNRELAVERLHQHHRYSNRLKLDIAEGFPEYFGDELPDLSPSMDETQRRQLKSIFGTYGERSWTGLSLHARFAAIEQCWTDETARRQARFFHLWIHRENNETLHPSAYSLANVGSPASGGENELHFMTGSTEHLLGHALLCAYWTYVQTVTLVFQSFGLERLREFEKSVIEPGFKAVASAQLRGAAR
jgi:Family of unknown function (DUF5677)